MGYEKDVASIDAIIHAVYDVISGPAGSRDWERLRFLMHPATRMMRGLPAGTPAAALPTPGLAIFTSEQFIEYARDRVKAEDFYEYETGREVFQFSRLAHVVSAYASTHAMDQTPFAGGINSIQLWYEDGRWWVLGILWDWADGENHIPAHLLGKAAE
jgi:hypothetical protein